MKVLSYKDWRYFDAVIEKAKIACQNSEITDIDHFVVDNKMVQIGSGTKREQQELKTLINFIILDIKACTMEKQQMT